MDVHTESAVRAAFDRLVDYAGLFPPAELDAGGAVTEYHAAQHGAEAWMLGRFVVAAARAPEVVTAWPARDETLHLSLIAAADRDPRRWFDSLRGTLEAIAALQAMPGVAVDAIEIPLAPPPSARETFEAPIGQLRAALDRAGVGEVPAYAELPAHARRDELLGGAMAALGRARLGAKIRCGGLVADAFPSVDSVATFIAEAAAHRIPFKATAGLHHPVRHLDPATGFTMHGFLNVLAAAAFAPAAGAAELRRIVAEDDPRAFGFANGAFAWRDRRAGVPELQRTRTTAFVGYGSCSFSEPVDDLTALGMLPAAVA